jgi:hypothetical protein
LVRYLQHLRHCRPSAVQHVPQEQAQIFPPLS